MMYFNGSSFRLYVRLIMITSSSPCLSAAGRPGVGQRTWLNHGGRAPAACRGRSLPGSDWTFPRLRCHWTSLPLLFRCSFCLNPLLLFCHLFQFCHVFTLFLCILSRVAGEEAGVPAQYQHASGDLSPPVPTPWPVWHPAACVTTPVIHHSDHKEVKAVNNALEL